MCCPLPSDLPTKIQQAITSFSPGEFRLKLGLTTLPSPQFKATMAQNSFKQLDFDGLLQPLFTT